MMTQNEIRKLHNGLIKCPLSEVGYWMPEILDIVESCPRPHDDYFVDAKVHMLMPEQFPCVPNWHCDAVNRGIDGKLQPELNNSDRKMYLWLSGPPLTEFRDGREVNPMEWVEFTQNDEHRGVMSNDHTWRLFIRLMPRALVQRERKGPSCVRRHSQVYLDSETFTW